MIKEIKAQDLRRMNGKEGLILQGCGGSLDEWVDGINEMLTEEGILLDGTKFHDAVTFENESLTCLLFPFTDDVKLDVGKLAMWRLGTHGSFGGTWLSDYVDNRLGGFLPSKEDELTLFFQLFGQCEAEEYDYAEEYEPVSNDVLLEYSDDIDCRLKEEQSDFNMAEFLNANLKAKIKSVVWSMDVLRGNLVGRVDCTLTASLTDEETQSLKDWIRGQNSDGLGEGFEQRPIETDIGKLYVSFWQWESDNEIRTQDEMEAHLTNAEGIGMGGM